MPDRRKRTVEAVRSAVRRAIAHEVLEESETSVAIELPELARLLNGELFPHGADVESVVFAGRAAPTIADHAAEGKFDLIVMGTHGRDGLSHLLMAASRSTSCGRRRALS